MWEKQDIVDLWVMGIYFTDLIYTKSILGFMGISGKPAGDMGIYGKPAGDINPHKSEHGFSINEFCKVNPHNP